MKMFYARLIILIISSFNVQSDIPVPPYRTAPILQVKYVYERMIASYYRSRI